ncbi:hypothetical protein B2M27_08715 [Kluyvera intermedia]|uniref:Uncharacterized protein n=1 Tax=Kluyvera intermedia TaxID=61648 RepID=A0ABX3UGM2_KLUIN|nr:hypothetical protein B2M27_08715 [Kluyvera intermedia]
MARKTNRRIFAKGREKKSSGITSPLLEFVPHLVRSNSLIDLFFQQLWNNIGSIPGKFTSFYRTRRRLA